MSFRIQNQPTLAESQVKEPKKKLHGLKPYLADNTNLFEVDPSRCAPQRLDTIDEGDAGHGRQRGGIGGWLSDLLERTVFW